MEFRLKILTVILLLVSITIAGYIIRCASEIYRNLNVVKRPAVEDAMSHEDTLTASTETQQAFKHIVMVIIVSGIGFIIVPITTNLLSYWIINWFDQRHNAMYSSIDNIWQHVKREPIVLKYKKNSELHGKYDKMYNNAVNIKISGIRASALISYICKEDRKSGNWVDGLKKRKNVTVKILAAAPDSPIIGTLEKRIGAVNGTVKGEVSANLEKLERFSRTHYNSTDKKLAIGSSIAIRITDDVQYFNITYTGHNSPEILDQLLIFFSFIGDDGPVYQIHQVDNVTSYQECNAHFDELWKAASDSQVFCWDHNGPKFNPDVLSTKEEKHPYCSTGCLFWEDTV